MDQEKIYNHLLNLIIEHVKPSTFDKTKPFAMLSTLLYADSFLGRSLVGRIAQGTAKANQQIKAINLEGKKVDEGRLTKIFRYEGTKKVPIEEGEAGDIVIIAGLEKANVADTICDLELMNQLMQHLLIHLLCLLQLQLIVLL